MHEIAIRLDKLSESVRWQLSIEAARMARDFVRITNQALLDDKAYQDGLDLAYRRLFEAYDRPDVVAAETMANDETQAMAMDSDKSALMALGGEKNRRRIVKAWIRDGGRLPISSDRAVDLFRNPEHAGRARLLLEATRKAIQSEKKPEARRSWFLEMRTNPGHPQHTPLRNLLDADHTPSSEPPSDETVAEYWKSPNHLWVMLEKYWPEHPPLNEHTECFEEMLKTVLNQLSEDGTEVIRKPWFPSLYRHHAFTVNHGRIRQDSKKPVETKRPKEKKKAKKNGISFGRNPRSKSS